MKDQIGKVEVSANGFINFDQYVKISSLIRQFVFSLSTDLLPNHKKVRREFLKN